MLLSNHWVLLRITDNKIIWAIQLESRRNAGFRGCRDRGLTHEKISFSRVWITVWIRLMIQSPEVRVNVQEYQNSL
jgi:hypothetical protein